MAKVVSAMQLAAHTKSSTLYGRSYGRKSKFFRLDGLLLFRIIIGLFCPRCDTLSGDRNEKTSLPWVPFPGNVDEPLWAKISHLILGGLHPLRVDS